MKQGWEVKKLGAVCDFQGGSQPPKSQFVYGPKEGYVRFLQIRDFASDKNITYIPESKKNRYCNEDDILLGRYGASVGKVLINKAGAYNVAVIKTIPKETILLKRYLFFYLNSYDFQRRLLNTASRSAQDGFSKDDISDFPILIPPLPEQQRIVSILDEAFAAIAKAKANAEQNLKNAKELFESYFKGLFVQKGDGWEEKKLGDVVNKIMTGPFGSMLHQSDYVDDGIPVVNPQNIVDGKIIPLSKTMINHDTFTGLEKYALKLGDIVFARRGQMGRCAVVRQENVNWLCGTGSFVIRVNSKKSDSDFLNVILSSNSVKQQLEKSSIGATMSNLNQTILFELPIRIPTVEQQKTIVNQLDALSFETKRLEAIYQQKLLNLEELKKSILKKAFAGDLKIDKALVG